MIERKIQQFIDHERLLTRDGLHLVALSGGADSVAMMQVLLRLGYNVEAMHCNFHLRGEESNRDEEFCRDLCAKNNVPLHIAHFDTKTYAQLHKVSIEMAARDLRYNYFRQILTDLEAESICVAHHKDDSAETLLMNIIRGTGLKGLTGIRPRNGVIMRPMLCVERSEIEDYLSVTGQDYVNDSTNFVDDVTRNKIRLNIMPMLAEINPSIINALASTARNVMESMLFTEEALDRWMSIVGSEKIDVSRLKSSPSPEYLLYHILSSKGVAPLLSRQIAQNLDAQTGREWSSEGKTIVMDRGYIIIADTPQEFHPQKLPIEGNYTLQDGSRVEIQKIGAIAVSDIDRSKMVATLDAKDITFPLTIRTVREGDRFSPFGMKGTKLVSDFLTDRKLSIIDKRCQLCVTDASGEILWIVGHRTSETFKVTDDTINCIVIRYIQRTMS